MHMMDHGEKIKHREPDGGLDSMGIGRQIAAFQKDAADIRILFYEGFCDFNNFKIGRAHV